MTVLVELAAYCASTSHGLDLTVATSTVDGNLWRTWFPQHAPDIGVAMLESAPRPTVRAHRGSLGTPVAEQPSVQITVREKSTGYDAARDLAESLKDILDGLANVTLSGTRWLWCTCTVPQYTGLDENERHRFVLNLDIRKERS